MLVRRKVRSLLMSRLGLTASQVQSHVNGSLTVAQLTPSRLSEEQRVRRANALHDDVVRVAQEVVGSAEPVAVVREGVKGRVVYVTITTPGMIAQAGQGARRGQAVVATTWPEQVAEVARELAPVNADALVSEAELVPAGVAEPLEESER